jgi:hypothetical protein
MAYSDLLDRCDWYQSFDNTATPSTSLSYVTRTTANADGSTRYARTYSADVPFGSGYSMTIPTGGSESEDITSLTNAYAKPASDTYDNGSTIEFWIKIPATAHPDQTLLTWPDFVSANYSKNLILKVDNSLRINGNFIDGNDSSFNVFSTPTLTTDVWHHIALVTKYDWSYVNATDQYVSIGSFIYVDGIITATFTTNPAARAGAIGDYFGGGQAKSYPRGVAFGAGYGTAGLGAFSNNYSLSGIKIAHLAYWAYSAQTQKQIARRYMYGKTKYSQTALATANNPLCYNTLNAYNSGTNKFTDYIGTNDIFTGLYNTATAASIDTSNMSGLNKRCISTFGKSFTGDASGSLQFGAPGSDVTTLKSTLDSYNFTIEHWIKFDFTKYNNFRYALAAIKPIFTMYGSAGNSVLAFRLTVEGNLETSYRISDSNTNNFTTTTNIGASLPYIQSKLTDGDWHHFALTSSYVGTTLTFNIYLDGILVATSGAITAASPANTGSNNYSPYGEALVSYAPASTNFVANQIDCVGIYPTTLTQSQIADRYRAYVATGAIITRAYDGTNWNLTTQQKVYNGTDWVQWQEQTLKKWDGAAWVTI